MSWAISSFAWMRPLSGKTLTQFTLIAVFLEAPPRNELPFKLSLKIHLELSFPSSACISFHTSLLVLPSLLGLSWRFLIALESGILFRRVRLWILDCTMPLRHTGQPPEQHHHISACNINNPSVDNLVSRANHHYFRRSWTSPSGNIHELHYQNQIFTLYLEKCCLQRRKSLILQCQHRSLLCLPPLFALSFLTILVSACSPSSSDLIDNSKRQNSR